MKRICNNCGHVIPDGTKICPNCGTSYEDEEDQNNVTPPPLPPLQPSPEPQQAIPPIQPRGPKKNHSKFKSLYIILGVIVVALFALYGVYSCVRNHSTITITKTVNAPIPTDSINNADNAADTILEQMQKEAEKEMSEMDKEMSDEYLYGETKEDHAEKKSTPIIRMVGKIGDQYFSMKLNMKDPQNVKGTGFFASNGKAESPLQLIGILSGDGDLNISVYDHGNCYGSLNGTYDGHAYTGTYHSRMDTKFEFNVAD
jgi:predicted  nucleic acid-binding Zn-ribbon protein